MIENKNEEAIQEVIAYMMTVRYNKNKHLIREIIEKRENDEKVIQEAINRMR